MNKTKIEYLTHTWNPIAMRCTPTGSGCANCWHLAMADRLAANPSISEELREAYAGGSPVLVESRLPVRRKKPARVGVQFMGDLFHKNISDDFLWRVFGAMWKADQHTYLVLTKRPTRMYKWMEMIHESVTHPRTLNHIHLGVSVSTQDDDWMILELLHTPAAVRFVSFEPLLERIDVATFLRPHTTTTFSPLQIHNTPALSWGIVGAESGPHRRPMKLEWAADLVRQCKAADVPVFVKQVQIDNRVSHDPDEWPEELRVREYPMGGKDDI